MTFVLVLNYIKYAKSALRVCLYTPVESNFNIYCIAYSLNLTFTTLQYPTYHNLIPCSPTDSYILVQNQKFFTKHCPVYLVVKDKTQSISYLSVKVVALGHGTWEKLPGIGVKFHHASIRTTADTQLNESSHQCMEVQTN